MNPTLVREDMRYWRLAPDARLRSWIICYFVVEPGAASSEQALLIPDGHSELVFRLDAGFERWPIDEPGQRAAMRFSYLIGGRSHSVLTQCLGRTRLAGVKLDPRALRALIRTPLSEFRDGTLAFADLNSHALLDLEDAVATAPSAVDVGRVLDRFFLRALCRIWLEDAMTDALVRQIQRRRGALSILEWVREHRIDPRTLERRFCASMGMMPKQYARIIRFKHSYHRLMSGAQNGALGSHLEGFYDESHFNREFRRFMGVAPSARSSGGALRRMAVSDHLLDTELANNDE